MALLTSVERAQAESALGRLASPVRLVFFEETVGCEACGATRHMLEQLSELAEHLDLETFNRVRHSQKANQYSVDRVPATIVVGEGRDRIRFYGAPLGNELAAFVDAVERTASGESGLSASSRARIATLKDPVRIQVFFTPTCVYCPQMISLASQIAVESPLVTATAIDAIEFPDLVRRYRVNGVPKTVINDRIELLGAVTEEELVLAVTEQI